MKCFSCPNPYHPATGHYDKRYDIVFCGACYRRFVKWLAGHLKRQWSGASFYEEAATSIRPGIFPPPGGEHIISQTYVKRYISTGKVKKEQMRDRCTASGPRGPAASA